MPIDMSAAKAPPRKAAATRSPRQITVAEAPSQNTRRAKGLTELGQLAQGVLLLTGQYADAAAVGMHFPPLAQELANVADGSDVVAKPIDFMIEVGPYGALIAAAIPLVLQVAANHKWVNPKMLLGQGVVAPEVLEAQMQAEMTKKLAEAARAQQVAIREAQQAQREYEEMVNGSAE